MTHFVSLTPDLFFSTFICSNEAANAAVQELDGDAVLQDNHARGGPAWPVPLLPTDSQHEHPLRQYRRLLQ